MFQQEQYDVEPKRRLKARESVQLMVCFLILLNSAYLLYYSNCDHYKIFNMLLFFGSLIWLIFILLTAVIQFRNKGTRSLFNAADWIFIAFHFGLFIWANVLYWKDANSCPKCWDFWVFIYLICGYFAAFAAFSVVFMWLLRKIVSGGHSHADPAQKKIHHKEDYTELGADNVDFYEY